jgi:N-methylhydantoinase B
MSIDPVTFNVLSHAFRSIATEMGTVLVKSAYTSIVREAKDAATSILDAEGRVVAQSQMIPMQLNSLASAFDYLRDRFDLAAVHPDEAFITNNPYNNGQHLNDIIVFLPAFAGETLIGFSGTVVHHADVGGTSAHDDGATHLIQEGLVIPIMKLPVAYLADGPFVELLTANVRSAELVAGDFRAQLSAGQRGCRLLDELVDKYGLQSVRSAMTELQDYAERLMRSCISDLADGTYEGEDFVDGHRPGDASMPVRVRVDIRGDGATVDLSGSADQIDAPLNSPIASTYAATYGFFSGLLPSGSPVNDGTYRAITIRTRRGSICDPEPPAPVHARMAVCYAISGALRRAVGSRLPDHVAASGDDTSTVVVFSYRQDGRYRIHVEIVGGGNGASARGDGADGIAQCLANSSNMPVEALETSFPALRIVEYGLIPNSGGTGRRRGGCGIRRVYEVLEDDVLVHTGGDGHMTPPWGLAGGGNGTLSVKRIERQGETIELPALSTHRARKGDRLVVETSGGGGYGDHSERAKDAALADLLDGLITQDRYEAMFGSAAM